MAETPAIENPEDPSPVVSDVTAVNDKTDGVPSSESVEWKNQGVQNILMGQLTTKHEHTLYHILLFLFTAFLTMVFSQWGSPDGNTQGAASLWSMWLKIVSSWVLMLLYFQVLIIYGMEKFVRKPARLALATAGGSSNATATGPALVPVAASEGVGINNPLGVNRSVEASYHTASGGV